MAEPFINSIAMPDAASPVHKPTFIIQPTSGWMAINLRELWRYRDLLLILAEREVKLRYKQTALGVVWVVLQPLIAALIFAVIFGRLAKLPSDGVPYTLFTFCGLVAWSYFSGALLRASNSLVNNSQLISKIYFPRLLIPIAHTLAVLIDFAVTLVVLLGLMLFYHYLPTWRALTLPFFLALIMATAAGVSLWVSALSVKYRDFMYALPFLIMAWMYVCPIVYATSIIPERWRLLYSLNPVVGFIEGFRWAMLGKSALTPTMLIVTIIMSLFVFLSGALFFRRVERGFADVI
jgi:lipopolysaccharide transport system permease protein